MHVVARNLNGVREKLGRFAAALPRQAQTVADPAWWSVRLLDDARKRLHALAGPTRRVLADAVLATFATAPRPGGAAYTLAVPAWTPTELAAFGGAVAQMRARIAAAERTAGTVAGERVEHWRREPLPHLDASAGAVAQGFEPAYTGQTLLAETTAVLSGQRPELAGAQRLSQGPETPWTGEGSGGGVTAGLVNLGGQAGQFQQIMDAIDQWVRTEKRLESDRRTGQESPKGGEWTVNDFKDMNYFPAEGGGYNAVTVRIARLLGLIPGKTPAQGPAPGLSGQPGSYTEEMGEAGKNLARAIQEWWTGGAGQSPAGQDAAAGLAPAPDTKALRVAQDRLLAVYDRVDDLKGRMQVLQDLAKGRREGMGFGAAAYQRRRAELRVQLGAAQQEQRTLIQQVKAMGGSYSIAKLEREAMQQERRERVSKAVHAQQLKRNPWMAKSSAARPAYPAELEFTPAEAAYWLDVVLHDWVQAHARFYRERVRRIGIQGALRASGWRGALRPAAAGT
jgi:hypothetical protein